MTSHDIADLLAEHYNSLGDKPIEFFATNPEVINVEKESSDWAVFVGPFEESEAAQDRGDMCDMRVTCQVVVHGPVSIVTPKSAGIALVHWLRNALRETELGGYRWVACETVSLFDFDALVGRKMFVSWFNAEFQRYG